jgi:hypothetical protein
LAEAGDKAAEAALELASSPDQFLPTVQIGITLVGTLAAADGGECDAGPVYQIAPPAAGRAAADPAGLVAWAGWTGTKRRTLAGHGLFGWDLPMITMLARKERAHEFGGFHGEDRGVVAE